MSALFSTPSTPAPRDLATELQQTYQGYAATAPGYLALNQQYQPQYAQLGTTIQAQQQPQLEALNTQARAADIADVQNLGPQAVQAQLNANPLLAGSLNNLYGRTQNSSLLNQLNSQASDQLALNGALTPQQMVDLQQQTEAGFSSRGMLMGNQSLGADILSRDAATQARAAAAQQFAGQVQGLNLNQSDLVGRASQIFGTQLSDPYLAILGRGSTAGSSSGSGAQQIGTGAQLFNPTNPYAADVYNTNFNAQSSAAIAGQNQQAAETAALISATGAIAGAALSDRRLKKNIKPVGKTPSGHKIIEFSYKGDDRKFVGGDAQDVEKKQPDAVITMPVTGYKMIDLSKVDIPFYQIPTTLSSKLLKEAA